MLFRNDLSAVISSPGGQPQVVLKNRTLHAGDMYSDGWKLASVTPTTVVLSKGADTRRVGVFSPPIVIDSGTGPVLAVTGLQLSNGLRPGEISGQKIAQITGALSAAGATPAQVARILHASWPTVRRLSNHADTAAAAPAQRHDRGSGHGGSQCLRQRRYHPATAGRATSRSNFRTPTDEAARRSISAAVAVRACRRQSRRGRRRGQAGGGFGGGGGGGRGGGGRGRGGGGGGGGGNRGALALPPWRG